MSKKEGTAALTAMQLALLILFVGIMSVGQVLFKIAAGHLSFVGGPWSTLSKIVTNPYLIAGVAVYGAATILWVWILRDTPISRAYPFMALSLVVVPLIGIVFFQEPISPGFLLGAGLLLSGLIVIALAS